jgi:thiamine kinase-like enzyme
MPTHKLITDLDQVTPAWLTGVLCKKECLPQGQVLAVHKEPNLSVGSTIVLLKLCYSDDAPSTAPTRLFLKFPSAQSLSNGKKEVQFYTDIASEVADLVVRCYDAVYSEEANSFHLLMEDLSPTHFSHPPSVLPPSKAQTEQIVDALACFHAYWWDHPRLGRDIGPLPTEASLEEEMAWTKRAFASFVDFLGDRLSDNRRKIYERVLAAFLPVQLKRLSGGNHLTLIHGDLHIGNFLYPRDPVQDTLRIIDWKSWRVTIGASDMAHMMAVFWFPERRAQLEHELLKRYYNRLLERGVKAYTWKACWYDYRFAVIDHLFYPIWQWSTNHIPDLIWWHHLERLMLAFQDLECAELLEG